MSTASPSSDAPTVAVVTVSYGSENVLAGFLRSVPAASSSPVVLAVADNKAEPGRDVASLTRSAGAHYVPLERNLGYGGGMNAAIDTLPASITWVLVSNPDVVLTPGCIDVLVEAGNSDPAIGSVGPAILTSEGDVYPSARSVPSLRTGVGHALFANIWLDNPWTRSYRRDTDGAPVTRDAGWLSGACVLVRRSAFEELGGFDNAFFMYFEDVDLGYRLGRAGYRNLYEPKAVVTHSGAHSTTTESERMVRAHHDSARRFLNKKYAGPLLWPVRATLTLGLTLRSALVRHRLKR